MDNLGLGQPSIDQQLLEVCFTEQKKSYLQQPYPSYEQRIKLLQALRNSIIEHQLDIISAINVDFGFRSDYETKVLELFPCLEAIDYAISNLKTWMKIKKIKTSKWFFPSRCYLLPQPKGVVGIIVPWNYPLFLAIAPLVAALAAGNRVMLKLSEYAPNSAALLKKIFHNIFMESQVAVVLGAADVAIEFCNLPFDHLLFTGSTANGKKVMRAASSNLTPVTLELGGKSPAILLHNEIQKKYIGKILLGKIINSGQTCIAPDYLWLPKGNSRQFLDLSKSVWNDRFKNISSCGIINKEHYDRIIYLINQAVEQGAKWYPFENLPSGHWHSHDNDIYKIAVGLLLNAQHTMKIMQQEIFGPVLPIMEYDTFEQLLSTMQVLPRPLAIYLFTENKHKQQQFITNTISGALCFNSTIVYAAQEALPFGGIGTSGMGNYRGIYGFKTFSLLKPIYKQSKLDIFNRFYPPIKTWRKKLLNYMLK